MSRPNILSDPAGAASIQNRLKQREAAAGVAANNYNPTSTATNVSSNTVPVYELHAATNNTNANISSSGAPLPADATSSSLMYSGLSHRASSPSVVGTANQSRSLRDRIYERTLTRSPLPPPTTVGGVVRVDPNATKDVYAHEQGFPVQTVFEVQRVSNPLPEYERPQSAIQPQLKQSDTLLTDLESASLIKTLEKKLVEGAEAMDAQKAEMETLKARNTELEGEMEGHQKTAEEATNRLVESQAQCEAARQSIVTAVDTERSKLQEEFKATEEQTKAESDAQIAGLQEDLDKIRQSVSLQDNDHSSLFTLVGDLQKAVREGAERQKNNAEIIARLDRELQESRQRAATVSTGFHAKDKQVRDALSNVDALQQEVGSLQGVRVELLKTKETLDITRKQCDEAMSELVPLRVAADEKVKLQQHCGNLDAELSSKNDELGRLRGQVDVVRQQADAAFARSSNFQGAVTNTSQRLSPVPDFSQTNISGVGPNANTSAMAQGAGSYATIPIGGTTPALPSNGAPSTASQGPHADALKQLKADIMAEDARTDAERNKWKAGTN